MNAPAVVNTDARAATVLAKFQGLFRSGEIGERALQIKRREMAITWPEYYSALNTLGVVREERGRDVVLIIPKAAAAPTVPYVAASSYSAAAAAPLTDDEQAIALAAEISHYLPRRSRRPQAAAQPPADHDAPTMFEPKPITSEEERAAAEIIKFLPRKRLRVSANDAPPSAPETPAPPPPKPVPAVEDDDPEATEAARQISQFLPRRRK